ncbi:MAG: lipase maturation factor family protein [Chlamydiales bacterium]|nr:lipase maturation factor family protein [Chlamydiales bacterium]
MFDPESYVLTRELFLRLLGVIYFIIFFPYLFQIRGLLGKEGILPIGKLLPYVYDRLGARAYTTLPSIFWFNCTDTALMAVAFTGTALGVLLACGIYPFVMIFLLYVLYLSIVSTGQDFLSFGWDVFILEITCNAFFLSLTEVPNIFCWISINILVIRFHIQAGAVKLQSRDKNWWNLTALKYHYQTQPLPNTQAWYIHKFPMWFHKLSCLLMFAIELVVPLFAFGPDWMRFAVWGLCVGLQVMIWFTGNFAYLTYLTVALCTVLLSDAYLSPVFGSPLPAEQTSLWLSLPLSAIGITLITLQCLQFWHHFFPTGWIGRLIYALSAFHIVNRYGIFAVMTTKRYEIVIEGSDDGIDWKEYEFKYKPSEVDRRPRRISPYHPRLDWQAWFLPFSSYQEQKWFQNFLYRLLQGKEPVCKLLRHNPFVEQPPRYIRAVAYDYVFTTWLEKQETGNWWKRTLVGNFSPILQLNR